jgi:hypothetical protein
MSFSDEDLKRFKNYGEFEYDQIVDLLARLEAAEAIAGQFTTHRCGIADTQSFCDCGLTEAENTWRKSAGK